MKTYPTSSTLTTAKCLLLSIGISLFAFSGMAQKVPALYFKGAKLVSGKDGEDGAVYLFPGVTAGVDAQVTIAGRYSSDGNISNVVLNDLDQTGTGYDSAWQPLINYTNGSSIKKGVVTEWYIEFQVAFLKSSNGKPTTVKSFDISGLDIDGNATLHEFISFYNPTTYTLENPTSVTATSVTSQIINAVNGIINIVNGIIGTVSQNGKRFDGGTDEYDGIDVNASKARVTSHYDNTSSFSMRIGGKATGPFTISNNGRQNSIYFQSFSYTNPVTQTLPVSLMSFDGQLAGNGKVNLNWVTSVEIAASHFVVERSSNGKDFEEMAIIATQEGNSNTDRQYGYADNIGGLTGNMVYYRLNMVDMDGNHRYSNVIVVRVEQSEQVTVLTFPNPATSELRVTIPASWQNSAVSYSVYALSGAQVQQQHSNNAGQTKTLEIAQLTPGIYLVEVRHGSDVAVQKFIKAK